MLLTSATVGVEVADAADPDRLAVDPGEQQQSRRRHQVGRRPGGDLGLEVDRLERAVGLADEVGVERGHLGRRRRCDALEGRVKGSSSYSSQVDFSAPVES